MIPGLVWSAPQVRLNTEMALRIETHRPSLQSAKQVDPCGGANGTHKPHSAAAGMQGRALGTAPALRLLSFSPAGAFVELLEGLMWL